MKMICKIFGIFLMMTSVSLASVVITQSIPKPDNNQSTAKSLSSILGKPVEIISPQTHDEQIAKIHAEQQQKTAKESEAARQHYQQQLEQKPENNTDSGQLPVTQTPAPATQPTPTPAPASPPVTQDTTPSKQKQIDTQQKETKPNTGAWGISY